SAGAPPVEAEALERLADPPLVGMRGFSRQQRLHQRRSGGGGELRRKRAPQWLDLPFQHEAEVLDREHNTEALTQALSLEQHNGGAPARVAAQGALRKPGAL